MQSFNRVQLIGTLGVDPTINSVGENQVMNLSIATEERFKRNEEWVGETTWHIVELWNPSPSVRELKKGSNVFIEGTYKGETYEKEGHKKYVMKVKAKKIIPLA